MAFENGSLSGEFFVIFIVDSPDFDEPILRGGEEMVLIKL
jgi:hypothetical protein